MQNSKEKNLIQLITKELKTSPSEKSKKKRNRYNKEDNLISFLEIYQIRLFSPSNLIDTTMQLDYSCLTNLLQNFMYFREDQVFDYVSNLEEEMFITQMPIKRKKTIYDVVELLKKNKYKTNLDEVSRILKISR